MKKYTINDFLSGRISVRCAHEEHFKTLLKECEKRGIVWQNGAKATNFVPWFPVLTIGERSENKITQSFGVLLGHPVINYDDLCFVKPHRYKIIIYCDGDITTARMIVNDKEVKTATAKRNPADKFSWKLAAALAFGRLWDEKKDEQPKKQPRAFKVGDRVVCIESECSKEVIVGKHGRVIFIDDDDSSILNTLVEFDKNIDGHNGDGRGKDFHCYWLPTKKLRHE